MAERSEAASASRWEKRLRAIVKLTSMAMSPGLPEGGKRRIFFLTSYFKFDCDEKSITIS
ncbi:hypothetical protein GFL15_05480 [Rhizobium leguminosarum bv. viciae]|nr:hypothetical protein [Rhizobium leguminosarum bv. viciae]